MTASPDLRPCVMCGRLHSPGDLELVFGLPDDIYALTEADRAARAKVSPDVCMLDDSRVFVRGVVPFPVHGRDVPYRIGAWAEVTTDDFQRIYDLWTDEHQSEADPVPGTLANEVQTAPGSNGLALLVRLTGPSTRPDFILNPSKHVLAVEQGTGISEHRASEHTDRKPSHAG